MFHRLFNAKVLVAPQPRVELLTEEPLDHFSRTFNINSSFLTSQTRSLLNTLHVRTFSARDGVLETFDSRKVSFNTICWDNCQPQ